MQYSPRQGIGWSIIWMIIWARWRSIQWISTVVTLGALAAAPVCWSQEKSNTTAQGLAKPMAQPSPNQAQRIVSLDLCTDEMMLYYSARDPALRGRIAALSPLSYLSQLTDASRRTQVKALFGLDFYSVKSHDGSLEQILDLNPDLVLSGPFNAIALRQRLLALGLRVKVLDLPHRLNSVAAYEGQFLQAIGLPASLADTPQTSLPSKQPTSSPTLLLLGPNGIAQGTQTFEGDILEAAGWFNYIQQVGYVTLDLERIAKNPPNSISWSAPTSPALANMFAQHPVLKRTVPSTHWIANDFWRWQCPGPWSWDLVKDLERERLRIYGKD